MEVPDKAKDSEVAVIVATAMCRETWLPKIILGIPMDEDDEDDEDGISSDKVGILEDPVEDDLDKCAVAFISPEDALKIGTTLIVQAQYAQDMHNELLGRSLEERKEIVELEAQFADLDPD